MAINATKTHSTYYVVEADCEDRHHQPVIRYLGTCRGMSDNGYPAWTAWGGCERFLNLESAMQAATQPWVLSSYDSHYKGGQIRISLVTETIVTTKSVEVVHVSGENKS